MASQARLTNAASASTSLQRCQSEQMDIFLSLMAQVHKLPVQKASTALPSALPTEPCNATRADHFSTSAVNITSSVSKKSLRNRQTTIL